jgi:SpoVK/Ycf46/Vps4 family AAA+-type ATPase
LRTISERFRLPAAYIRQAAGAATAHAGLEGRDRVGVDDVQAACRMLNRQLLDSLATRLDGNGSWSHLVVSEGAQLKLRELERRCRHREALQERLAPGFGSGNRGVRALFTGPSGTGKTLAARILASRSVLGLDLYRVDLAAVVNKYIGETEKNLHRILTRAEELDVILLLDEGDALLGQRTEVKSANDRYANLETNYLLQRLETYQGIVIVTTNAAEHIDTAFQRRMDVVVNFVAPQAQERWRIWRLHLPADHVVETQFLDDIAKRCALSGGQIRNAALLATLLAVDAGEVMQRRHVAQAIDSEYRKAGAISPLRDIPATPSQDAAMRAFINALST